MATPILARRTQILCKSESPAGTDANPVAGTDALLVSNVSIAIDGEDIERDLLTESLSRLGSVPGIRTGRMRFATELRGIATIATAGTPLRENPLYRSAAYTPSYAASSVTYQPTSNLDVTVAPPCTLYAYLGLASAGGVVWKFVGCRATFDIVATNGQYGRINWDVQGTFAAISTTVTAGPFADVASITAASYQAFSTKPPKVHGSVLSAHGINNLVLQEFTFNAQNDIQRRENFLQSGGIEELLLVGRNPVGTINPEASQRAFFDPFLLWESAAENAVNLQVGTVANNIVKINGQKVQFGIPEWAERNSIRTLTCPMRYNRVATAGDDEVQIIYQ